MNAKTIECWLEQLSGYKGVYPGNLFPSLSKPGDFCIVNSQCFPCVNPIGHWLCMSRRQDGKLEFFDSYGNHPTFYGFTETCVYQPFQLQSYGSKWCGQYCVFYVLCRHELDFSLHQFVRLFSKSDQQENDEMVLGYLSVLKKKYYYPKTRIVRCTTAS